MVTVTRRSERAQDVPISIAALAVPAVPDTMASVDDDIEAG